MKSFWIGPMYMPTFGSSLFGVCLHRKWQLKRLQKKLARQEKRVARLEAKYLKARQKLEQADKARIELLKQVNKGKP